MKKALIFAGGWEGHEPLSVAERLGGVLKENGFSVDIATNLDVLSDASFVQSMDLLVPCWTMGKLPREARKNICAAVENGTGMAGCHGGMCDAFREDTDWQFLTGGQFVAHPSGDGTQYTVHICTGSPITDGIGDFDVCSEQYYMHVDPAVQVLATTHFEPFMGNPAVEMPVVWTKRWGKGRVFYSSLGHHADQFDIVPQSLLLMERGMLWASR